MAKLPGAQSASAALQELKRRIARLFLAADVKAVEPSTIAIDAPGRVVDLSTMRRAPHWGRRGGLFASDGCKSYSHGPKDAESALRVRCDLRGGPGSRIEPAAPVIRNPLFHPSPPSAIPLLSAPKEKPNVIEAEIARPKKSVVQKLDVSRISCARPKRLQAEKLVKPKTMSASLTFFSKPQRVLTMPARIANRAPMVRRRLPMPPKGSMQEEYVYPDEKNVLASANNLDKSEIRLVGVYLGVPLGAASQMEFDEATGSLLLTLRENASKIMDRVQRPVVTLVLGKVKATGRVIRAFL